MNMNKILAFLSDFSHHWGEFFSSQMERGSSVWRERRLTTDEVITELLEDATHFESRFLDLETLLTQRASQDDLRLANLEYLAAKQAVPGLCPDAPRTEDDVTDEEEEYDHAHLRREVERITGTDLLGKYLADPASFHVLPPAPRRVLSLRLEGHNGVDLLDAIKCMVEIAHCFEVPCVCNMNQVEVIASGDEDPAELHAALLDAIHRNLPACMAEGRK